MADSQLKDITTTDANPAPTDLVYVQIDPAGSAADRKVTLSTLRKLSSDYVEQSNAYRTAGFTAVAGNHYHVDIATAAADVPITFPTSPAAGDQFRVTVASDDLTNGYAVKWVLPGSDKIHSGTDDDPWWLFIEGDTIVWEYSGNATFGWGVAVDGIIPHNAGLNRTSAQACTNNAQTKINLDTQLFDSGNIGDPTTSYRINIRRDGCYNVFGYSSVSNLDSGETIVVTIYVNGSASVASAGYASATNVTGQVQVASAMQLNAGDYLELYVYHNEGADQNTSTFEHYKPRLSVTEVR